MVGEKEDSRETPGLLASEAAILQSMTEMLQGWLVQRSVLNHDPTFVLVSMVLRPILYNNPK